jgi:hypothetical protein
MRQDWTPQQTADFIRDLRTYDKDWARIWHTHGDKRTDGLPSLYPVRCCSWQDAVATCPLHPPMFFHLRCHLRLPKRATACSTMSAGKLQTFAAWGARGGQLLPDLAPAHALLQCCMCECVSGWCWADAAQGRTNVALKDKYRLLLKAVQQGRHGVQELNFTPEQIRAILFVDRAR